MSLEARADGGEWQALPSDQLADGFFQHTISSTMTTTWQAERVELMVRLPRAATMVGLRLRHWYVATDFEASKPDPGTLAEVAVSSDGFRQDTRVLRQPVERRYHYMRGCYDSQFFSEIVDSVDGVTEEASAVRITLTKPAGGGPVRVGRLVLLVAGEGDTTPVRTKAIAWGSDGSPHLAIWEPNDGRLAVLGADGKPLWTTDLSAAITGLACDDLDGDGVNELVVTAADWRLHLFGQDGSERIVKDWRGVYEATGVKYYYGGTPHGVGVLTVPGQRDGFLLVVDPTGRIVRQVDVGEEVLAVGAIPGPSGLTLLAATPSGTRCYDTAGRPIGAMPMVAQRFDPATHEGRPALLATHADGRVELLAP